MIQVDVFWSYALGAMFAAAACRQLKSEENFFVNKYFITIVVYLALFFAPSGLYLLWAFPHWESMQVFWQHSQIPPGLVIIFGITNVTNGILGYLVVWFLAKRDHFHLAQMQWMIGYFCMFFILVHGWDGTGYQRFLYDATLTGMPWTLGSFGVEWVFSNVAITLYVMGILILPPLFYFASTWMVKAAREDPGVKDKVPKGLLAHLIAIIVAFIGVFAVAFGLVILASIVCWSIELLLIPLSAFLIFSMVPLNSLIAIPIGTIAVGVPGFLAVYFIGKKITPEWMIKP